MQGRGMSAFGPKRTFRGRYEGAAAQENSVSVERAQPVMYSDDRDGRDKLPHPFGGDSRHPSAGWRGRSRTEMKLDQINSWLTLTANIGLIAGLLLVAVEIRQNSELMKVQISQARADAAMASNEQSFNSPYLPAILVKVDNGDELNDEEWLRYVDYFRASNRNQDNVLSQYNAGMLGENIPRSVAQFARQFVGSSDYSRRAWELTKPGYTDEYIHFVETALGGQDRSE